MNDTLATKEMCDYIEKTCGIRVEDKKLYLLETRLTALLIQEGCADLQGLLARVREKKDSKLRDQIVDAMTTNETLWFRDQGPWALLRGHFLPRWSGEFRAAKRKKVRIWSAACSSGQEAYSLAMLLLDWMPLHPGLRAQIIGTDIYPFDDVEQASVAVAALDGVI